MWGLLLYDEALKSSRSTEKAFEKIFYVGQRIFQHLIVIRILLVLGSFRPDPFL